MQELIPLKLLSTPDKKSPVPVNNGRPSKSNVGDKSVSDKISNSYFQDVVLVTTVSIQMQQVVNVNPAP